MNNLHIKLHDFQKVLLKKLSKVDGLRFDDLERFEPKQFVFSEEDGEADGF